MKNRFYAALVLLFATMVMDSGLLSAQTCGEGATLCITVPTGGDCASIGAWKAESKTCTLKRNLTGKAIRIAGDGITLDGAGHILAGVLDNGHPQPNGVLVEQHAGVTITNLTIRGFQAGIEVLHCTESTVTKNAVSGNTRVGIELIESNKNRVTDNTVSASGDGIIVNRSVNNTLEGNTAESNRDSGIMLNFNSSGNTVTRNISRLNSGGISLGGSSHHNTISENDVTGNTHLGVALYFSSNENVVIHNHITGNAVSVSDGAGVLMMQASGNRFSNNTVAGNSRGIWLAYPESAAYPGGGNEIFHNNFIDNGTQALITGWRSTPDSFSRQAPVGGNFWGNWTTPDADGDGVVDSAYLISGGGDNMPWRVRNGWVIPPEATPPDVATSSPGRH